MGVLFAAAVMMASLLVLTDIYNKGSYLGQLKKKNSQIESEATKVERMRMHIDLVERRLAAKGSSINILDEIYNLVPNEIFLTTINIIEKKQVVFKGRAFAMSDVFKFVSTLEDSAMFENVKTTYTTTKKVEDTEYADFEIIGAYQD
ncbi:MAG: PilN domain-containing protein [Candidatus Omnitrophica bacterium]|nr:PilN domain-containing protein [Candidatus Omnitrophota bacterium]